MREPISIVQIDQDFCSLTWGQGDCLANSTNAIFNSADITDSANWTLTGWSGTNGASDPDGTTKAWTIERTSGAGPQVVHVENLVLGAYEVAGYYSGYVKAITGAVDGFTLAVRLSGGGLANIAIDLTDGSYTTSNVNSASVSDEGSGWYKFEFDILAANLSGDDYYFVMTDGGGTPATGQQVAVYALQVSHRSAQPYLETTGTAVTTNQDAEPCFNTRATCQAATSYDLSSLPLKFVSARSPQLRDDNYFPFLGSVRISGAKLNPGGSQKSTSAFGKRATISINLNDHIHSDYLVDPYRDQRNYDPLERATFFTKWRARNPYYLHRLITFTSGYFENGTIVDTITRKFVMTDFSGPDSNGAVTINGKDILALAEGGKAQAPLQSYGELSADITDTATSATLTPSGIGAIDYPASGKVRIEKEIASFTRSGDVLTLTRGLNGTTAKEHSAGANVQLCLEYSAQGPTAILNDLLANYANIPASFLDTSQWTEEGTTNGYLPRLYSALISEPESVSKLVSEMCEQMYFSVWYDERTAKVKIRAVRFAADEEITDLDDNKHLLRNSVSWQDLPDELATQVWIYYGQINPTEKLEQASNFAAVEIAADTEAEGETRHNIKKIKKVFSRWIDAGNASAANDLATILAERYGNIPRECGFTVDAKDRGLWLSDFVRITNRLNVDSFGQLSPADLQIYQAEEIELGSKYRYIAQQFIPASLTQELEGVSVIIGSDLLNVNLRTLYDSQIGVTPQSGDVINFTIRSGVIVGGDAPGGGVNIAASARSTTNDTYDAGPSDITGEEMGQIQPLIRQSQGSSREITAGNAYDALGDVDYKVKENPASVALQTGTWPAGVELNLIVESGAMILGESGTASKHGLKAAYASSYLRYCVPGGDGGHALDIDAPINILNNGIIAGGGGGGGCHYLANPANSGFYLYPGGSGAGSRVVLPSTADHYVLTAPDILNQPGTATSTTGATGAQSTRYAGSLTYHVNSYSGTLQAEGGDLAEAGNGSTLYYDFSSGTDSEFQLNDGGLAGAAVLSGLSDITWTLKGDVRGAENS